jgi:hypothetical protein
MTQLDPIGSSEIGTKLGDNLAFKPGTFGRFSRIAVLTGLVWPQIR